MKVEVDQSGKVEHLNTSTVVAYSNGKSAAVAISAVSKRKVWRAIQKSIVPEDIWETAFFTILVFLAVKDLPNGTVLVIDEEYTGKERQIERMLTKLMQLRFKSKWQGSVGFKRIGKQSRAHAVAWTIHRGKKSKYLARKITEEEILKYL